MKPQALFLAFVFTAFFGASYAAPSCSHANLTRCLDSVCAINISSNPSARCQYCGTSGAGTPPKNAMRSVSAGSSAKYNISDKELKKAPTDPGERYAWATSQCIAKVSNCTPDDVSEVYDKLIEQSCTAAGVSAQMKKLQSNIGKSKSKSTCESEITVCITDSKRCTSDYRKCEENSDFDKFFSVCSTEVSGCDEHVSEIRTELLASNPDAKTTVHLMNVSKQNVQTTCQTNVVLDLNVQKKHLQLHCVNFTGWHVMQSTKEPKIYDI